MSADQSRRSSVAFDDYPQTVALKSGEVKSDRVALDLQRHQAGQQVLQADGARAEIRRQRDGDRDLAAGQGLRQAAGAAAGDHHGALPARHAALQFRARHADAVRSARQARRRALLQPDDRHLDARHPAERLRRRYRSHALGHARKTATSRNFASRRASSAPRRRRTCRQMLRDGEIDAAIYGAELPDDPGFKSIIPDPGRGGAGLVRQAQAVADQSHGGGDRKATRNRTRTRSGRFSGCWRKANGGRSAEAGRGRFPALRGREPAGRRSAPSSSTACSRS